MEPGGNLENLASKIMPYQEYARIEVERSYSEEPYIFDVNIGSSKITYIGVGHSNNPESGMYAKINKLFKKEQPDLVLVEGMDNFDQRKEGFLKELEGKSEKEIIERAGESTFMLAKATGAGIDVDSPEPSFSEEIVYLQEKGFSHEEIFVFDMTRILGQYYHGGPYVEKHIDIEEYFDRYSERFAADAKWEDFDWSFENYKKLYVKLFGKNFNDADGESLKNLVDPVPWEDKKLAVTNRISHESSLYRDVHIIEQIIEKVKIYKHIFIVFGATHARMQEPALRYLASLK